MKTFTLIIIFLISTLFVNAQFGHQIEISKSAAQPNDIKAFDMDLDGDMDVLSASYNDDKIAYYENLGGGIFNTQVIISNKADGARSVYAADFDGDGLLDVVSASELDNKVAWYRNMGNNTFDSEMIINGFVGGVLCVYADDLDGDGDIDVLSASTGDNKISWYENDGLGNFGVRQDLLTSPFSNFGGPSIVLTADIDNDGDKDVISGNRGLDKINSHENLGGGVFANSKIVAVLNSPMGIFAADLDGDGDQDIVATEFGNYKVNWYENDSTGTYGPAQTIYLSTISHSPWGVSAADLDADGDMDVLATLRDDSLVIWFENNGTASFSPQQTIMNTPYAIYVSTSDIDNDGDIDVLAAGEGSTAGYQNKISWSANNGAGIFSPDKEITSQADGVRGVCAIDVEGDGDMDIFGAGISANKFFWYENLGVGTFGPMQVIDSLSVGAYDVFGADLDGDGLTDLIGSSHRDSTVAWFKNNGNNTFGAKQIISNLLDNPRAVYADDLDGDGDMDVVTASNWDDKVAWFENNGSGVFGPEQLISLDNSVEDIVVADIDNDGDKDIISGFWNGLAYYLNDGSGNFGAQQLIPTSGRVTSVYAKDLDLDGDLDLIYTSDILDQVGWFSNDGIGNFGPAQMISNQADNAINTFAFDIEGDGDIDIISASSGDDKIAYYENNGSQNFGPQKIVTTSSTEGASFVFALDFDNDGDQELISGSMSDDKIAWYENFFNNPKISGSCFYDINQNGVKDANDIGLSFIKTILQPTGLISFSDNQGNYIFTTDTGTFTLAYVPDTLWNLTSDSSSYTIGLSSQNQTVTNKDFGFYPSAILTEIVPTLTGGFPRCNNSINYWIDIRNQWTTLPSGVIHLVLDDSIVYNSSDIVPDSIVGQNIYWHYDSLQYFSNHNIRLNVTMPPFISIGDTLTSYLNIYELNALDSIIYSNADTLKQTLVCAYDPNDKGVNPKGIGPQGFINKSQKLEYLIRFQNTGNDTAITVIIRDQLDENFNWNSLKPLASSHPMTSTIDIHGRVVFKFENIMLPDSNVDESRSHGFVKYSIRPKTGLYSGTPLFNTANIYFDSNPPVVTNTTINTIDTSGIGVNIEEVKYKESNNVIIYPNPFTDHVVIYYKKEMVQGYNLNVFDVNGRVVFSQNDISNRKYEFDFSSLSSGLYFVMGTDKSGHQLFNEKIISK